MRFTCVACSKVLYWRVPTGEDRLPLAIGEWAHKLGPPQTFRELRGHAISHIAGTYLHIIYALDSWVLSWLCQE